MGGGEKGFDDSNNCFNLSFEMKTIARREETRDRIIASAGAVFAERGFRGTTIRQITARARVNLAAVNYYFRDKNELYLQVLKEAKRHVQMIAVEELPGTPEEKLRAFVDRFVRSLLDPRRPFWHGRVISLEMSNPTPALGVIIREVTAPLYQKVRSLIGELVDGSATPEELDLLTLSVIGQCVFYVCSRPLVEQLALDLGQASDRIDRIARHVGDFSMAALRDFRRHPPGKPRPRSRPRPLHSLLS
jgi:AcrR family transcriptional regulator